MAYLVRNYLHCEDGAVTVDWVVLTAAVLGLGMVVVLTISGGVTNTSDSLGANLNSGTVRDVDASGLF